MQLCQNLNQTFQRLVHIVKDLILSNWSPISFGRARLSLTFSMMSLPWLVTLGLFFPHQKYNSCLGSVIMKYFNHKITFHWFLKNTFGKQSSNPKTWPLTGLKPFWKVILMILNSCLITKTCLIDIMIGMTYQKIFKTTVYLCSEAARGHNLSPPAAQHLAPLFEHHHAPYLFNL